MEQKRLPSGEGKSAATPAPAPALLAPRVGRTLGAAGQARDRLQPALLDRLTDAAPHERTEAPDAQAIDGERLRAAVLRDLAWLLNTANAEDGHVDWSGFEAARASVVNYGMRPLAGRQMAGLGRMEIEASIREAIVRFEPRILPDSVEVRSLSDPATRRGADAQRQNVLAFEIKGMLWREPYPVELVVRSDVDLETGAVSLQSLAGG
jgi:type VI secretion system protein ImpF